MKKKVISSKTDIQRKYEKTYIYLIKWIIISLFSGIIISFFLHIFIELLSYISDFILNYKEIPLPVWTILGALITGSVIYKIQPYSAGEGMPSYIRALLKKNGIMNVSETFYKFWAALLTLSTFGNGGIIGPIGRVSSGIMSFLFSKTRSIFLFTKYEIRTSAICGLAATLGSVFHTSIGGGIFAVEIIKRADMKYKDLFPAILSSSTAVFISKFMGWSSYYEIKTIDKFMDTGIILWLILFCVISGFLGMLYTYLYFYIAKIGRHNNKNIIISVLIGSFIAAIIVWPVNPELMGTSTKIIKALGSGNTMVLRGNLSESLNLIYVLSIIIVLKAVANCITVGSGMSAGFTGPSTIIGMSAGVIMALILGYSSSDSTYFAFMAAGFSGVLASTVNVPIAAAIMTIEIFGLQNSFPAALAAVIGFQVNRFHRLYEHNF